MPRPTLRSLPEEFKSRLPRVRFKHPVRVVPIDGPPRAWRLLSSNLSRRGMFLNMPNPRSYPLEPGTKVALSLEAGGRVFPFAQGEVAWRRTQSSHMPGRDTGFGVRFTGYLNPRSEELLSYLTQTLDRGVLLRAAPKPRRWTRPVLALVVALGFSAGVVGTWQVLSPSGDGARVESAGDVSETALAPLPELPRVAAVQTSKTEETAVAELAPPPVNPEPGKGAVEAAKVEAAKGEAAKVEAAKVEAAQVEAAKAETAKVEASKVEASKVEASKVEASKVEAAKAETAKVEAAKVEFAKADTKPRTSRASTGAHSLGGTALTNAGTSSGETGRQEDTLSFPSGPAVALQWRHEGNELRLAINLAAEGTLKRRFLLTEPSRVVFDLEGPAPKAALITVPSNVPHVKQVRIGAQGTSTRVVLDLDRAPAKSTQATRGFVLSF